MIVGLYVRVSTQEQALNGSSMQEQEDRLKQYAAALDMTVYQVYRDPGYSGSNTNRPGLQALIADVKSGNLEKIVVFKLDRLSRSQKDTLMLIEDVFLRNRVEFVSMCENFDTATPLGKAMIGILAVFAQLEREQIKERMIMGKEARAKSGQYRGSWNVPIGFDYSRENGLTVNEYEAAQIQRVYELYLSGTSVRRIEHIMEESGYTHKYGKWSDKTIRGVLRSQYNIGNVIYRGTWYKGNHEPIISEQMYEKAVAMLDASKERWMSNARNGKISSYLGGLLYCKQCGSKYTKKIVREKTYYICYSKVKSDKGMIKDPNCRNKNWKMEALDELVFGEIRKLSLEPQQAQPDDKDYTPILKKKLSDIDAQIKRLIALYAEDNMPLQTIRQSIETLSERRRLLEKEVESIKGRKREQQTEGDLLQAAAGFDDLIEYGTFEEIRQVICDLIDHIELDGEDVHIVWNL